MRAIIKRIGTAKTKPITGDIVQDGFNRITLLVIQQDGTKTMKSFTKDKHVITYIEEGK